MTQWKPIETAPKGEDQRVLLACFPTQADIAEGTSFYVVSAIWGTEMPGWVQLASYSGWFVDPIPLEDPPRRKGIRLQSGILSRDEFAPTHWCEIPE